MFVGKGLVDQWNLNVFSPLQKGVMTDWDGLEKYLEHILSKELKVPLKEHAVFLSDQLLS